MKVSTIGNTALKSHSVLPRRFLKLSVSAADKDNAPKKTPKKASKKESNESGFGLDELDPVRLGRKSRQAFDEMWSQFATLASPTRSFSEKDLFQDDAFDVDPEARNTNVLVVGAAGRTGRIVLRKLLLRGYRVRAFVRDEKMAQEVIPSSVEVVIGDITDRSACSQAMIGIDKVIFTAASRSDDPDLYYSIFRDGLKNVLHAFMDYKWVKSEKKQPGFKKTLADFKKDATLFSWTAAVLGRLSRFETDDEDPLPIEADNSGVRQWTRQQNSFVIKKTPGGNIQFKGAVNDIGKVVEIEGPIDQSLAADSEGIIIRLRGDGNVYAAVCTRDDGKKFSARFVTKWGYSTVRIPFTLFRPDWGGNDTLEGSKIVKIGFRYENRGRPISMNDASLERPFGRFNLEVDWIKTLPTATSTEFVLISCAGVPREGIELEDLQEILTAKRIGEAMLRNSGVAYTIVRPTTLIDEPGGLKALVFDQGDRVSASISAVDVADVCVRALPQPLAGNKTFEVANEASSTEGGGDDVYELVAHVPDKSTNYMRAALGNLQKNT